MRRLPFAAGDVVAVRGNEWTVEEIIAFHDCALLRLSGRGPDARERDCRLLYPFDRVVRQILQRRLQVVSPRRWMRALQSHLAGCRAFDELQCAAAAFIDVLPFQLEPAIAVSRGLASRVLIADEVGLGKTIQAGLILGELRHRGWCDRALVLTPAGLREQWAEELNHRFKIRADIIDAASLRTRLASLPSDVNPWSVDAVSIASIDFVKQPEVLQPVASLLWDLVVVDEAHQVAAAQQRSAAINQIASRARHIILLTATPHDGDGVAYRSLCAIGSIGDDDPIAVFRRTRNDVGQCRRRRVHLLRVRLSRDEMDMHRLLADYATRVWRIGQRQGERQLQLVATVLTKRALSSAASLGCSVRRRLDALAAAAPELEPLRNSIQPGLPFQDDEDTSDVEPMIDAIAFEKAEDERSALGRILASAERARLREGKIVALLRLLHRLREPAIVFTEYRDTLTRLETAAAQSHTSALLHGGMNRHDRRAAVERFTAGAANLLLATDAGSEGLNLHRTCRVVINLELPWNPVRLEQRIGRVDRIGQTRTVHAIHLCAAGTAEGDILARLLRRVERIRTEADIALEIFHDHQPEFAVGG